MRLRRALYRWRLQIALMRTAVWLFTHSNFTRWRARALALRLEHTCGPSPCRPPSQSGCVPQERAYDARRSAMRAWRHCAANQRSHHERIARLLAKRERVRYEHVASPCSPMPWSALGHIGSALPPVLPPATSLHHRWRSPSSGPSCAPTVLNWNGGDARVSSVWKCRSSEDEAGPRGCGGRATHDGSTCNGSASREFYEVSAFGRDWGARPVLRRGFVTWVAIGRRIAHDRQLRARSVSFACRARLSSWYRAASKAMLVCNSASAARWRDRRRRFSLWRECARASSKVVVTTHEVARIVRRSRSLKALKAWRYSALLIRPHPCSADRLRAVCRGFQKRAVLRSWLRRVRFLLLAARRDGLARFLARRRVWRAWRLVVALCMSRLPQLRLLCCALVGDLCLALWRWQKESRRRCDRQLLALVAVHAHWQWRCQRTLLVWSRGCSGLQSGATPQAVRELGCLANSLQHWLAPSIVGSNQQNQVVTSGPSLVVCTQRRTHLLHTCCSIVGDLAIALRHWECVAHKRRHRTMTEFVGVHARWRWQHAQALARWRDYVRSIKGDNYEDGYLYDVMARQMLRRPRLPLRPDTHAQVLPNPARIYHLDI